MKDLEQLILSKSRPVQKEAKRIGVSELDKLIMEVLEDSSSVVTNLVRDLKAHINNQIQNNSELYIGEEAVVELIPATDKKGAQIKIFNFSNNYNSRRPAKEDILKNIEGMKDSGTAGDDEKKPSISWLRSMRYPLGGRKTIAVELKPSGKISRELGGNASTLMEEVLGYYISGEQQFMETAKNALKVDPGYFGIAKTTYEKLNTTNEDFKAMVKNYKGGSKPYVINPTKKEPDKHSYSQAYMDFKTKATGEGTLYAGQRLTYSREGKTDVLIESDKEYKISVKDGSVDTQLVSSQGPDAAFMLWVGMQAEKLTPDEAGSKALLDAIDKAAVAQITAISEVFSTKGYKKLEGDINVINKPLSRLARLGKTVDDLENGVTNELLNQFQIQLKKISDTGKKAIIREAATGEYKFADKNNVANWMLKFSKIDPAFIPMDQMLQELYDNELKNIKIRVSRRGQSGSSAKLRFRIDNHRIKPLVKAVVKSAQAVEQDVKRLTENKSLNEVEWHKMLKKVEQTLSNIGIFFIDKIKKIYASLKEEVIVLYNKLTTPEGFAETQEYLDYEITI
jgi:hypothetical protein